MPEFESDYFAGTEVGYHVFTIAMYMNELVRKVDPQHRPIDVFFREELAKPLGMDIDKAGLFLFGCSQTRNQGTEVAQTRCVLTCVGN